MKNTPFRFVRRDFLALSLGIFAAHAAEGNSQEKSKAAPWRPELFWGTVNFNDQLTQTEAWRQTAAQTSGMLLHIHFFVRHLTTPDNKPVANVEETIRKIAPSLAGKPNLIELTYHINYVSASPEAIARTHAQNVSDMERLGISIAGVNVDWILSGFDVQMKETPRRTGETDDAYYTRILNGVLAKSARYVAAFRASGRDEKLYAVFPPVYVDEGPWINARKAFRPGITISRILNGLFDAGFDGFTADSPHFVLANPAYKAAGYFEALRSIERTCRKREKTFGFIVNGDNAETGAAYDDQFAEKTRQSLDMILAAGLRPDPIIAESWYKGPFGLVPETKTGTFTHTVLQIAERLRGFASPPKTPVI